jgi:hypothetical protein
MTRYIGSILTILSLFICVLYYSIHGKQVTKNINDQIKSRAAQSEQIYLCIDEIVFEKLTGVKKSDPLNSPRAIQTYVRKSDHVPNAYKLILTEIDKNCNAGN